MRQYIDRDLALSHPFANDQYDHEHANEDFINGHESYKEWLEQLPTADVIERKHGEWIWMGEKGDSRFMCSVCKCKENVPTCNGEPTIWWCCPNCGATMDGNATYAKLHGAALYGATCREVTI